MTTALRTENREETTFSDRTRRVVIALACLSLVATIAVLVVGRRLTAPPALPRDSYGRGPLGHRAWLETLQATGVRVTRWTRPAYADVSAPLFLIEPDHAAFIAPDGTEVSIAELCESRAALGRDTVIVLPKWAFGMLGAGPELPSAVREVLTGTPFESAQLVWQPHITGAPEEIAATSPALGDRHLSIPWPQTVLGPTPLVSGPTGTFIAVDPSGHTFLVADPDLLHNFAIQRADHASLAHDFVTSVLHADAIVVDEVFHEHIETRSLAEVFSRFPGVLALVHGALVVLVVLLYGRRRFGPPRAEPTPYGRGPREVIDVASGVLASGQSVERLAPRYVEQVILDAHRRLGLTEGRSLAQKAAALDAMLVRRGLPADAVRLLETSQGVSRDTALPLAARATRLRAALLGQAPPSAAPPASSAPSTPAASPSTSPPTPTSPSPPSTSTP